MSVRKYGLIFPDGINVPSLELKCYREYENLSKVSALMLPKWQHLLNAITALWPETFSNGKRGIVPNKWLTKCCQAWCANNFLTVWGPTSSGKSKHLGAIILAHWLSAPDKTTCIVCSTTVDMLEKRVFGYIIGLHSMYEGNLPGTYLKTKRSIVLGDEQSINGIFGIAVQRGTVKEALGNMVGIHNEYNVLFIDEMQATREAAVEAHVNLSTGREAKFAGAGNPESRLDPLGMYSEPTDGWNSITPDSEEWKTRFGYCIRFDGTKSPGIDNPERYFFFLQKKQIERIVETKGPDSPVYWSQIRGFIPPEGLERTLFTETLITKFHAMEKAVWVDSFSVAAGIDPSYAAGGDRCVIKPFKYGIFSDNGLPGVEFLPSEEVHIQLSSGEPVVFQLANDIQIRLQKYGIMPDSIGMDTTGVQGMLADVIEKQWANGIHRVNFGGKPTDLKFSVRDERKAREACKNRVTELWFNLAELIAYDQVRGLDIITVKELCRRRLSSKDLKINWIESKVEMKARTGESPDNADAAVTGIAFLRERLGWIPGSVSSPTTNPNTKAQMDLAKAFDIDGREENYLSGGS